MSDQDMTAVEALLQFARAHVDDAAAQALVDEAARELSGRTVVRPGQQLTSRRFVLRRHADISGISGLGDVADGVLWPDGTAEVRWRGEHPSVVHWDRGRLSVETIHGHGGATEIVWLDDEQPETPVPAGGGEVPLKMRRMLDHALRRPVPCPQCSRVTPCPCGVERAEGRIDAVIAALAPWLNTSASEAA
ncbi:hypothetical protein [Streptomyces sp. NPDC002386]